MRIPIQDPKPGMPKVPLSHAIIAGVIMIAVWGAALFIASQIGHMIHYVVRLQHGNPAGFWFCGGILVFVLFVVITDCDRGKRF